MMSYHLRVLNTGTRATQVMRIREGGSFPPMILVRMQRIYGAPGEARVTLRVVRRFAWQYDRVRRAALDAVK